MGRIGAGAVMARNYLLCSMIERVSCSWPQVGHQSEKGAPQSDQPIAVMLDGATQLFSRAPILQASGSSERIRRPSRQDQGAADATYRDID